MNSKTFSKEQQEEIITRYQSGESLAQISKDFDSKGATIGKYLKKWGVAVQTTTKRKFSPTQEMQICDRYAQGESVALLAKELEIARSTVRSIVKASGGEINPRGQQYRRFTPEEVEDIRQMSARGMSQHAISKKLDANQIIISRVMDENKIIPTRLGILRGEKHGSWKGGRRTNPSGYVEVKVQPDDPMASMRGRTGYVLEHRIVLARAMGRPLQKQETVHHINGDRQDNRIENLQLRAGRHGNGESYCCADCGSRNIIPCKLE